MRRVVLEHVPLGTNVNAAQKFMEAEGFSCERLKMEAFPTGGVIGDEPEDLPESPSGVDFLECVREQSAGFLMGRIWSVRLLLEDETVSDIRVSVYIDGP